MIVSPTRTDSTLLIAPATHPTSPAFSSGNNFSLGVFTPTSVTTYSSLLFIIIIVSPVLIDPDLTQMDATTPLYWSKYESNISAFVPSFKSCGEFILSITASNNNLTFSPVLPLTGIISSSLKPRTLTNSAVTFGTSAFGKSILFITGIIVKL